MMCNLVSHFYFITVLSIFFFYIGIHNSVHPLIGAQYLESHYIFSTAIEYDLSFRL